MFFTTSMNNFGHKCISVFVVTEKIRVYYTEIINYLKLVENE